MPPRGSLPRGEEEAVPLAGVPACKRLEGDLQKFLLVGVEGIQLSLGTLQRVLKNSRSWPAPFCWCRAAAVRKGWALLLAHAACDISFISFL